MNKLVNIGKVGGGPSIMDFATEYLRLSDDRILRPFQKFVLELFYARSLWNEDTSPYQNTLFGFEGADIIRAGNSGYFDELVLQIGRRGGKDYLLSVIANYEFFKLIFGDCNKQWKLVEPTHTMILCICGTTGMAKNLYNVIKMMMLQSSFHRTLEDSLRFVGSSIIYTDAYKNTVELRCSGSSNVESLMGLSVHTLIINDIQCVRSPTEISALLWPVIKTYDGNNPGKMIITGLGSDIVNQLFIKGTERPGRLCIRASTWVANPCHTKESLRDVEKTLSDEGFRVEYGAEYIPHDPMEQVTFRLKKSTIERFKKIARQRAYCLDEDILYTDIIRDILESSEIDR